MADKVTTTKTLGVQVEYLDTSADKKTATFKIPNYKSNLTESEIKEKFQPFLNITVFEDENEETPNKTILSGYIEDSEKVELDIGWQD